MPGTHSRTGSSTRKWIVTTSRYPSTTRCPGVRRKSSEVRYTLAGVQAAAEQPAHFRYEGPWVGGEKQKVLNVVPVLSVRITPEIAVVPRVSGGKPREFRVRVLNNAKTAGRAGVRLEVPPGWSVQPRETALDFRLEEEERPRASK